MSILDDLFARYYDTLSGSMERHGLSDQRAQLLGGVSGDVLEVGAGTGRNLEHLPANGVRSLTLTEPSPPMLRKLQERVAQTWPTATVVQAPAEALPFDDASFDTAVATLVLCSVDDVDAAVSELRRVLRPDGQLVVIEHVRADGRAVTAQRVWEPVQKVLGRNCHLTRDTRAALERGGFDTAAVTDLVMPGAPAALFPGITGIARLTAP